MLSEAKNHCDYLIAGLQTDPTIDRPGQKNPPVQSIVERQIQLAACRYVDEVVVYQTEEDLIDLLLILPNARYNWPLAAMWMKWWCIRPKKISLTCC